MMADGICPRSGQPSLDWGGDSGSSGKSSRNRDRVLLGTLLLSFLERASGIGPNCGALLPAIESREVLENSDGPDLCFLDPHRNRLLQDLLSLLMLPSDFFLVSMMSGLGACVAGGGGGDLDRDERGMSIIFFLGLRVRGTDSSSGADMMDALSRGTLSVLWKCSKGPCAA